ncbi:MAG: ABC-F family ATP-binding cassette domain-containing protein [Bryobacteraceae bacterium]|nr:ABC-F family ATP-binding cassette domain-containing protein [Bryobacteraceae bacterium]
MALLLNAIGLAKSYGPAPLFQGISLTISEGDRLCLIGPNGSGKSTLLDMLAGLRAPDAGEVALRKGTRRGYVAQHSVFEPRITVGEVARRATERAGIPEAERRALEAEALGRSGFDDFDLEAASLSGGWQKRLAIAEALVQAPDILLLDEPTNHLDIGGIEWLEELVKNAPLAFVIVSHDRYFLENIATDVAELSPAYGGGLLRVKGIYSAFLEKKGEFLHAQAKRQEALENRVRVELEWLRRGPKARGTKAKARIDAARGMIAELADLNARSRTAVAGVDFTATDRRTKRLVELEDVACAFSGRTLFGNLNFAITAGMRVGVVGPNGSGKTSLLRLVRGGIAPATGEIRRAEGLRVTYFDQSRRLDENRTLRRALAPDSDSVVYRDRAIHVNAWAARFLFTQEQLSQPVGRLSGGERARVLIANLMLEPADLLLLDEPTNDLDIPTLEILEESLLEFTGAVALVTHDRYLLDRVCTVVLGLDGAGRAERFADYSQWEAWEAESKRTKTETRKQAPAARARAAAPERKKLSYIEGREYAGIEQKIAEAEELLRLKRSALEDPAMVRDGRRLQELWREIEADQAAVEALYARWAELEEKLQL